MGDSEIYRVKIFYREPLYEMYQGAKERPFHWTYEVSACNTTQAYEKAIDDFKQMEKLSSVNWKRHIVAVELDGSKELVSR